MEYPRMEADSVTSVIKRRVKDKRISKMKLNVSLASKIKTKILNNSSIFKISLKHNNKALAQALSKEKETSRRITTEKMLLQKEVEKLNFENTFLRLKLNNLNKKLIEIESLMNNNLITAIEMSSLSEFHQSSFLLPASQKKQMSKQCKLIPFARVPVTSDGDGDGDDDNDGVDDNGKERTQQDNIVPETSPSISSSLSTRQSLSTQSNFKALFLKEHNQNVYNIDDSEHISSINSVLPTESHYHSDQTSKSSLVSEIRNDLSTSHRRENPSLSNVTERKKRQFSWESKDPITDISCAIDLDHQQNSNPGVNWNNEIDDHTNEKNIKMQRNTLSSESASESNVKCMDQVQTNGDFQLKKTVCEDAGMDLPASEEGKIVVISRGSKNKSIKKTNCGVETFRKVRIPSSEEKRERSKRKCKSSSDVDTEEKIESTPERRSVLDGKRDSEDPNTVFDTEKPKEVNILKKIRHSSDIDNRQNTHYNTRKKRMHETDEQKEAHFFFESSDIVPQENILDTGHNSITYNKKKASRQTFVIQKFEKDNLDITSQTPDVASEFQIAHLSSKDYGTVYDYETQNMLGLKKYFTDNQPTKQNESELNKPRRKINRRTEIISEASQISDQDKSNYFPQTQVNKETVSQSLEISKQLQITTLSTRDNGNLHNDETQNVFGLQKITDVYPIPQNKSKIVKKLRQKVSQKTNIISEMNYFDSDETLYCSKKDNSLFLQKGNEIILGNLKDSREFRTPALCTKDSGKLCDYETQSILEMKTNVHDKQPAYQNDSKIDKRLTHKVYQKTEVISEANHETDNGEHDVEKNHIGFLTQKEKDTISENLKIANEFQIAGLLTQQSRNSVDYETQNILDLEKHFTNKQVGQQNELKINKKRRLKVNRKTEIISKINQIYEGNDADDHKNYFKDDLKNQSEQNPECQDINESDMKVTSNGKESCGQIPNPCQIVKKHGKKSSAKAKNSLTREKKKSILLLTDSSQTTVSLESGLKHITEEADSEPGNQIELFQNQKQSIVTQNTKRDIPSVEVVEEVLYSVSKVNKKTSKSKKRKTALNPSPGTQEVIKIIPDTDHRKPVDSAQENKENYLENEKIVKTKSDFCTEELKPSLSEKYSSYTQNSFFNGAQDCSVPLSISSTTNLIQENCALESLPVFSVDDVHEKMKVGTFKINQRTKPLEIGKNKLQDLTNTCFISNNTTQLENEFKDLSTDLQSRKRRCTPLNLKEPGLKGKMRR